MWAKKGWLNIKHFQGSKKENAIPFQKKLFSGDKHNWVPFLCSWLFHLTSYLVTRLLIWITWKQLFDPLSDMSQDFEVSRTGCEMWNYAEGNEVVHSTFGCVTGCWQRSMVSFKDSTLEYWMLLYLSNSLAFVSKSNGWEEINKLALVGIITNLFTRQYMGNLDREHNERWFKAIL